MKAKSGTYLGNATDNTDITIDTGWGTPDFVFLKRFDGIVGSWTPVARSSTFSGDLSKPIGATAAIADRIQAFGSDTFQVSANNQVNRVNNNIGWMAFQDDGNGGFAVFSYTGDGGGSRTITPGGSFTFSPALAIVMPEDAADTYWTTDLHPVGDSQTFNGPTVTTAITALGSGSISVATALNVNTVVYHVAVWVAGAVAAVEYTGNGTGQDIAHGLGVLPIYVIVHAEAGTDPVSVWKVNNSITSAKCTGASSIGMISSFDSTNISVSTNTAVNESGATFHALAWPETFSSGGLSAFTLLGVG